MPQLRDAQTSEILAEGSREEVALMAANIGHQEVIFDDVEPGFDARATIAAYRQYLRGLATAASDAVKPEDRAALLAIRDRELARETKATDMATLAQTRMSEARARVRDRRG
jgi:hypothetical protein